MLMYSSRTASWDTAQFWGSQFFNACFEHAIFLKVNYPSQQKMNPAKSGSTTTTPSLFDEAKDCEREWLAPGQDTTYPEG